MNRSDVQFDELDSEIVVLSAPMISKKEVSKADLRK